MICFCPSISISMSLSKVPGGDDNTMIVGNRGTMVHNGSLIYLRNHIEFSVTLKSPPKSLFVCSGVNVDHEHFSMCHFLFANTYYILLWVRSDCRRNRHRRFVWTSSIVVVLSELDQKDISDLNYLNLQKLQLLLVRHDFSQSILSSFG